MQTTLQIDDDILEAAKSLASSQRKDLGQVISALARQALGARPRERASRRFPTFSVSADAPPLTLEMVRRAAEETG